MDWRHLVASQLHEIGKTAAPRVSDSRAYDLDCLRQVLTDYESVAEQEAAWCLLTRRSRATFFRLKRTLGDGKPATVQAAMGVGWLYGASQDISRRAHARRRTVPFVVRVQGTMTWTSPLPLPSIVCATRVGGVFLSGTAADITGRVRAGATIPLTQCSSSGNPTRCGRGFGFTREYGDIQGDRRRLRGERRMVA